MELEVEITRLGAQGDGVAQGPDGPIFVPFTLPGERVRIEVEKGSDHAGLLEVLAASPDRIAPICPISARAAAARSSTWSRALIFAGSASRWWPR
jgi:tRNA/tmRNA/rRNA uracil-C5-methylase (TrmA/RlmC/RlmD family)